MIPFYEYMANYKGKNAAKIKFCKSFCFEPTFPKGRNLMDDLGFWNDYYEQYLVLRFCPSEELEGFRRLFASYRKVVRDEAVSVPYVPFDDRYDSCFSKRMELYSYVENELFPKKSRIFYRKLREVYDEFSSLYVLPPRVNRNFDKVEGKARASYRKCEPPAVTEFLCWWFETNLPLNSLSEGGFAKNITLEEIKEILEECTSVYLPIEELESYLYDLGYTTDLVYRPSLDKEIEVYTFNEDLPVFRRAFLEEPSKKGDKSRWV